METQTTESTGLEGRLEVAKIIKLNSKGHPVGFLQRRDLDQRKVIVRYAGDYIGKLCVVRFDYTYKNLAFPPLGSFLSNKIPNNFSGLSANQFILYGFWHDSWRKSGRYPILKDIKQHFGLGDIDKVVYTYMDKGVKDKCNKFLISEPPPIPLYYSFRKLIEEMINNPLRNSQVIIVNSADEAYSVEKQARRKRIKAFLLQPLSKAFSQYQKD